MVRYVTYYRVSTDRQGRSGLGLEAQEAAVSAFLAGKDAKVVQTFTEIESGKTADRPKLREAMNTARAYGAVLLVAKLDRLSRDAHFLLGLVKEGIEFVAADMPEANTLTVGFMAVMAQYEANVISARTKAALAARKARGLPLGNQGSLVIGNAGTAAKATKAASEKAAERARFALPMVTRLRDEGKSLQAIARTLNEEGLASSRGGTWTATSVKNLLARDKAS